MRRVHPRGIGSGTTFGTAPHAGIGARGRKAKLHEFEFGDVQTTGNDYMLYSEGDYTLTVILQIGQNSISEIDCDPPLQVTYPALLQLYQAAIITIHIC
jgi:hypothetical protein